MKGRRKVEKGQNAKGTERASEERMSRPVELNCKEPPPAPLPLPGVLQGITGKGDCPSLGAWQGQGGVHLAFILQNCSADGRVCMSSYEIYNCMSCYESSDFFSDYESSSECLGLKERLSFRNIAPCFQLTTHCGLLSHPEQQEKV